MVPESSDFGRVEFGRVGCCGLIMVEIVVALFWCRFENERTSVEQVRLITGMVALRTWKVESMLYLCTYLTPPNSR